MQLLLLLGVTGKHTRNLSSMRFLVMLTRVPRTEILERLTSKWLFDKIFRTTHEKCLIWFQYKLLYNLLPTGRFLFQRQLVDSPVCVFCKDAEETLLHMFWDCPKIQNYWFDVQGWLHTSFTHCTDIIFSELLVWCTGMASYQLHTLYWYNFFKRACYSWQ